jgi:hypothetical protein
MDCRSFKPKTINMRLAFFLLFLIPTVLPAQVQPDAFYLGAEAMDVLEAYYQIVGHKDQVGISKGKVSFEGIANELDQMPHDEGLFSKVLFTDPKNWAHIEVNLYVHPAVVPLIAKTLGWKEEQVWAVAQFEAGYVWDEIAPIEDRDEAVAGYSGPEILLRELGTTDPLVRLRSLGLKNTDLIFSKVPVPPLSFRPKQVQPGGAKIGGPANFCLEAIAWHTQLYEFIEGKEERRYLDFYIQRYFSAMTGAIASPDSFSLFKTVPLYSEFNIEWEDGTASVEMDNPGEPGPEAMMFIDDHRLLVLNAPGLVIYDWEEKLQLRRFQFPDYHLIGLNNSRTTALFTTGAGLGQFNLKNGNWQKGFISDMNYVAQDYDADVGLLCDWANGHALRLWRVPDNPWVEAYSADHRYLWLQDREGNGGVFDLFSGLPVHPMFAENEEEIPDTGEAGQHPAPGRGAALGLYKEKWLMFANNILFYAGKPIFESEWEVTAACFDPSGTRLAMSGVEKACIIELAKGLKSGEISDFKMDCWDW